MNKAQAIERTEIIAHNESAEARRPRVAPFDRPTPPVATLQSAVLRVGAHAPMRCDHFHLVMGQCPIESVCIIGIGSAISVEMPGISSTRRESSVGATRIPS